MTADDWFAPALAWTEPASIPWPDKPAWMAEAACRGVDPGLFYPERGASTRVPKSICADCPVKVTCLDYAIEQGERTGVWGGTSERQRRTIRRERGLTGPPRSVGRKYDRRRIIELRATGMTLKDIADELGCSLEPVARALRENQQDGAA